MIIVSFKPIVVLFGIAAALALCGCTRPTAVIGPPVAEAVAADKDRGQAAEDQKAAAEQAGDDGFHFPDDSGGRLLAKLLAPADRPAPVSFTAEPRPQSPAAAVERPMPPLPPAAANPPHLPPA